MLQSPDQALSQELYTRNLKPNLTLNLKQQAPKTFIFSKNQPFPVILCIITVVSEHDSNLSRKLYCKTIEQLTHRAGW